MPTANRDPVRESEKVLSKLFRIQTEDHYTFYVNFEL